jgi:hypothetical protein
VVIIVAFVSQALNDMGADRTAPARALRPAGTDAGGESATGSAS